MLSPASGRVRLILGVNERSSSEAWVSPGWLRGGHRAPRTLGVTSTYRSFDVIDDGWRVGASFRGSAHVGVIWSVFVTTVSRLERMLIPELDAYPVHLHIDLLPTLQRRGLGRPLIYTLIAALRERGVRGLHLTMDPANTDARASYDRVGFVELRSSTPQGPALGVVIAPPSPTEELPQFG